MYIQLFSIVGVDGDWDVSHGREEKTSECWETATLYSKFKSLRPKQVVRHF